MQTEPCAICGEIGLALPASDRQVKRIFRALVRLHYSEWEYNSHLGGGSLQTLVRQDSRIFNVSEDIDEGAFEDVFMTLEDTWYPEDPEDISLGGGYWDGGVLVALTETWHASADALVRKSLTCSPFDAEPDVLALLERMRHDITHELPAGTLLSRARLGVKRRFRQAGGGGSKPDYYYEPYKGEEISSPPVIRATEGRLNRARVSTLYLASDPHTAAAELRPHPGHLISSSEFASTRAIRVANFTRHDIRNFLSDPRLEELHRILSLGSILRLPVQPEQNFLYMTTQLIADCLRRAGYEGLMFPSSIAEGFNVACFVDAFESVAGTEAVWDVRELNYTLAPCKVLPENPNAWFHADDESPLAAVYHGSARS